MTHLVEILTPHATPLLSAGIVGLIVAIAVLAMRDERHDLDTQHEREARR